MLEFYLDSLADMVFLLGLTVISHASLGHSVTCTVCPAFLTAEMSLRQDIASGRILYISTIYLWPYCWWVLKGATVLYSFIASLPVHYPSSTRQSRNSPILPLTGLLSCILQGKADIRCIILATTLASSGTCTIST